MCLHVRLSLPWLVNPIFASFIYAKCTKSKRIPLWDCLKSLSADIHAPWFVGGDFNVILKREKRLYRARPHGGSMEDFTTTLLYCGLVDGGFESNLYTWTNSQIFQRLDRELKQVVFGIDKNSVAGPDGFSSYFYQQCWDILADDLLAAVLDFFK
ncbi:Uncharacterized protein TCM_041013 [Theobroma cacao]|uniref:Uncharacterized protein n=1 Tax=Theobroma cacao TaxID=3641 RepID=A0A061GUZ2_THECC|nr:Uncharacterized protein TCM_041013 [Theobroma cacao]